MDKPWKVILAFVGVFMAGAVFGGLFTLRASNKAFAAEKALARATQPVPVVVQEKPPATAATPAPTPAQVATSTTPPAGQPPAGRPPVTAQERNVMVVMRQLNQRVSPTADQREKMRVIVGRATDDLQRAERDHWQEVTRVTDRMYEDLSGVLSPEQRIQLAKMRQEMFERVRNAKEKQRLESQSKGAVARPNAQNQNTPPNHKPGAPEGANPSR